MQHIGVITSSYPQNETGAEAAGSFVYDFINELSAHVKVTVFAPGNLSGLEDYGNFRVYRYCVPRLPLSNLKAGNPLHWLPIIQTLWSGYSVLNNALCCEKYDHLFALWAIPCGIWARQMKQKYGIHYSVWALGSDIWSMRDKPFTGKLLKKILLDARHCFADGYILKNDVTSISGRNCRFLPSARKLVCPETRNRNIEPPYNFAYLGRWHPNKGIDILLESLNYLDDSDWQSIKEIKIYGGGPLENEVSSGVDKFRHAGRPVYKGGYIGKTEAANLLLWADFLFIPSRIESIPVIFSDAIQCRVPVIAMPTGDLPALINDYKCGLLADEISSEAFARIIKEALKTPGSAFQEGLGKLAADFDINAIARNFINTIENSVN